MNRRTFLAATAGTASLAALGLLTLPRGAVAAPPVTVWKSPSCGCCGAWVEHMQAAGFPVTVVETEVMNPVKARLGVPMELASCHTAQVDGYTLEGHVPADAVKRLLAERPQGRGLAVPGMPQGSPGMETGVVEPYDIVLFGDGPARLFERR